MSKKVIVWGATGHAKVLLPIIKKDGYSIVAMVDRNKDVKSPVPMCPVFTSMEDLLKQITFGTSENISFAIAIGGDRGRDRIQIGHQLQEQCFFPLTLVHERAWVAKTAQLGEGSQVLGMAAVSEEVQIGKFSIINTNASVDHESRIGDGCHIMPGATLAGCVEVGDFCTIGSNATIFPRIKIGTGAVVGAGAVVTKDVSAGATVIGVPAK
jgi:sugar O-acyltransferase (sialic acid O-acetyltransferase NeuD family)